MENKMEQNIAKECLAYIDQSVSCYQAVETAAEKLNEAGFEEISEKLPGSLKGRGLLCQKRGVVADRIQTAEAGSRRLPCGGNPQ